MPSSLKLFQRAGAAVAGAVRGAEDALAPQSPVHSSLNIENCLFVFGHLDMDNNGVFLEVVDQLFEPHCNPPPPPPHHHLKNVNKLFVALIKLPATQALRASAGC